MSRSDFEQLTEVRKGQAGTGLLIENDWHAFKENDSIQQIREDIANGHQYVIPEGGITMVGLFQRANTLNANGRIYPMDVLKPAVDKYIRERVMKNCAIGSLNHPEKSELSGHDVSHVITELHWEGDALYGTLKLHLSPGYIRYGVCSTSGDLVANMVIQNILFGVSSRALGTVKQLPGNKLVVDDNLEILAWDTVAEPSTPGAWLARNREELRKYMEGKNHDDSNKQSLDEKIASINRVLQG